jgi:hypothetical protein
MAIYGRENAVRQLITHKPEKAVEILVGCCEDGRIWEMVSNAFVPTGDGPEPSSPRNNLSISFGPQPPMSPDGSQHSDSPRPFQRLQRYSTPITRQFATHSPPPTESSVTSRSSRDSDYGLFFDHQGRVVEEHLLRIRTANIEHSVIRHDIVHKRHLSGAIERLNGCYVSVTQSATPHLQRQVQAFSCINLDWRRPNSDITQRSTFYLVPRGELDTDVLLSYHDSGENGSGM